jgi:hypothetical protein
MFTGSQDSSICVATGYGMDGRGVKVQVPIEAIFPFSPSRPDRFWDPPNLLYNGYRRIFPRGVKLPGREADHLLPTSTEVKNT